MREMKDGQEVEVLLHRNKRWFVGRVIRARRMWVEIEDYYGAPHITVEEEIERWRPVKRS